MTSYRDLFRSARAELSGSTIAFWASISFSLFDLTLLISLAASQAFLAVAAVLFALHLFRSRPALNFPPVKLPLAVFCLTTVLSVFWAANPAVGWFAVRKLVLFAIWLLALNLVNSFQRLRLLLQGLFFESALAGVVGIGQFVTQYHSVRALHPGQVYFYMTLTRIHGFMGHWMNFGGQQMLVLAALSGCLLLSSGGGSGSKLASASGWRWGLGWLVWAMVATSILFNFTRGVWLGCLAAAIYLVGRWKLRWLWALPALLLLVYLASPSLVRQRVRLALHPSEDPALAVRLEMWQVALRMIRAHPWVGVGPNNVEQVYLLYLPAGTRPVAGYHSHFHNNFLQFGAERGLPCLAAWVWLMAALGVYTWRIRRRLKEERWIADAALAAWLAFLVEGCFEFNFGTSPVLMVFLFLVSTPFVAARLRQAEENPPGAER